MIANNLVLAQLSEGDILGLGMIGVLLLVVVAIALYLFGCYLMKRICENAGSEPGILIWIPILNIIPMLAAAELPLWTIILFFIPLVNLVLAIVMWVNIIKNIGHSGLLVILMFIPILNLLLMLYLAFGTPPRMA